MPTTLESVKVKSTFIPQVVIVSSMFALVLMNLIGNAVKFTANGSVRVLCYVDKSMNLPTNEVSLKFEIQYVL